MNNSWSVGRRQQAVFFEQLLQLQLCKLVSDIMTLLDACGGKIAEGSGLIGRELEAGFRHQIGIRQIDVGDRTEYLEALRGTENPGLELLIERSLRDNGREVADRLQQLVHGVRVFAILANPVTVAQLVQAIVDLDHVSRQRALLPKQIHHDEKTVDVVRSGKRLDRVAERRVV